MAADMVGSRPLTDWAKVSAWLVGLQLVWVGFGLIGYWLSVNVVSVPFLGTSVSLSWIGLLWTLMFIPALFSLRRWRQTLAVRPTAKCLPLKVAVVGSGLSQRMLVRLPSGSEFIVGGSRMHPPD